MATKDPITCHVLDTSTGRPAAGMVVSIASVYGPSTSLEGKTNSDGRISNWNGPLGQDSVEKVLSECTKHGIEITTWKLTFKTGDYYGAGNTFWPTVELMFYVTPGEHYHVPLLLSPYSYTTYRGS